MARLTAQEQFSLVEVPSPGLQVMLATSKAYTIYLSIFFNGMNGHVNFATRATHTIKKSSVMG